jgi:outer membrane protein assembly factor BamB
VHAGKHCDAAPAFAVESMHGACVAIPGQNASLIVNCDSSLSTIDGSGSPWSQSGGSGLQAYFSSFPGASKGIVNPTFASAQPGVLALVTDASGNLFYATQEYVVAVDGSTGAQQWITQLPSTVMAGTVGVGLCGNGLVYVLGYPSFFAGAAIFSMQTYSAADGSWVWGLTPGGLAFNTNGMQGPLVDPSTCRVFVDLQTTDTVVDEIVAVDGNTGNMTWQASLTNNTQLNVWGGMAVGANGHAYAVAWSGQHGRDDDPDLLGSLYEVDPTGQFVSVPLRLPHTFVTPYIGVSPADGSVILAQTDLMATQYWLSSVKPASAPNGGFSFNWNGTVLPSFVFYTPIAFGIAGDGSVLVTGSVPSATVLNAYSGENGKLLWSHTLRHNETVGAYPPRLTASGDGVVYVSVPTMTPPASSLLAFKVTTGDLVFNTTIKCHVAGELVVSPHGSLYFPVVGCASGADQWSIALAV